MPTLRPSRSRLSPAVVYVAFGLALVWLHASLEIGSQAQSLTYDVVGASAVAAALFGAWRNRPDRRLPWVLMAIGQGSFVAGDLMWLERGPTVRRREGTRLIQPRLEPEAG